jgi:hypothetical protein
MGGNIACKERKTTGIRAPRKRLIAPESIHSAVRDKYGNDRALTDRRAGAMLPFRHAPVGDGPVRLKELC